MKNLSPAMKAWYAGGATTAARCWRAVLQGGRVVAATTCDIDLPIEGVVYQSVIGCLDSDVESSSELNPDNLEVDGFLASPGITDDDIHSGAWDYAAIEMFEVNYSDLTMGKNILRTGTLGEVKGGRIKFTAELRGLLQAYTRTIVRLVKAECDADLGDARCKIDLAPITVSGAVASVTANRIIDDPVRTEVADWFTGGKLTWVTGANAGLSMEVKRSQQWRLELSHAMFEPIQPGDTYTLYPGCQKRFKEDCLAKFANGPNFRGFPDLPGQKIYRQGGIDYGDGVSGTGTGVGTSGAPGPGSTGGGGGSSGAGESAGGSTATAPGVGWVTTTTGAQVPDYRFVTSVQVAMGDAWYHTSDPANPWTTNPALGTLSHITVRKLYTVNEQVYNVGDVLEVAGVTEHHKTWNSPLGVAKTVSIEEVGLWNSPYQMVQNWMQDYIVRRIDGNVLEFWSVIPLSSQDDLDAYLNMPADWTSTGGNAPGGSATVWNSGGTFFDRHSLAYPMSYAGTVIHAGVESVQRPLSGALLAADDNRTNPQVIQEPVDAATATSITAIVPESGMARVTAPGHTFQNGDSVKITGTIGCNLVQHSFTGAGGGYFSFNGLVWLVSGVSGDSFLINFDASHGFDPSTKKYAYYTEYSHGGSVAKVTSRSRHLVTDWHVDCSSATLYNYLDTYPILTPNTDPYWPKTLVHKSVFECAGHGLQVGDMPWLAGPDSTALDGYPCGGMEIGQRPYNPQLSSSFPNGVKYKGQLVTEITTDTFTVHGYHSVSSQAEADALAADLRAKGTDYSANVYATKGSKLAFGDY